MSNYQQPSQYEQQPQWRPTGAAAIPPEDRSAAALAHASTLIAMVISAGWLSFVGPLIMWMLWRDRSPYVRRAAAGAFNFNIWLTIVTIIGWIMIFTVILFPIGIGLIVITSVMQIWSHLRATLRSLRGEDYRYPFQTQILK